jgi:hypothetical protein
LETISTKDIAIAVLGGSAAIASMLLVFVGFMAAKADSLPEETPDSTIKRYTMAAKFGLIPFLAQVFVIFASYVWMFWSSNAFLFYSWSIGFPTAVILFVVYSTTVTLLL